MSTIFYRPNRTKRSTPSCRRLARATATFFLLPVACIVSEGDAPAPLPPTPGDAPFLLKDPMLVLRVVDGDTIDVDLRGVEEAIRFKGINAPELYTDPAEPFAQEARDFVFANIGTEVDLEFDSHCPQPPEELCRDSTPSHRLLSYIRVADGTDLGARLLSLGLARVYIFNGEDFDRKQEYLQLQSQAQQANLGIWSAQP